MKNRQISSKIVKIIFLIFQSCFYTQTKQLKNFGIFRNSLLAYFKILPGILKGALDPISGQKSNWGNLDLGAQQWKNFEISFKILPKTHKMAWARS